MAVKSIIGASGRVAHLKGSSGHTRFGAPQLWEEIHCQAAQPRLYLQDWEVWRPAAPSMPVLGLRGPARVHQAG